MEHENPLSPHHRAQALRVRLLVPEDRHLQGVFLHLGRGGRAPLSVPDDRNNSLYERYRAEADKLANVHFGGRLGQYKYYDMDKVIGKALEFVSSFGSI